MITNSTKVLSTLKGGARLAPTAWAGVAIASTAVANVPGMADAYNNWESIHSRLDTAVKSYVAILLTKEKDGWIAHHRVGVRRRRPADAGGALESLRAYVKNVAGIVDELGTRPRRELAGHRQDRGDAAGPRHDRGGHAGDPVLGRRDGQPEDAGHHGQSGHRRLDRRAGQARRLGGREHVGLLLRQGVGPVVQPGAHRLGQGRLHQGEDHPASCPTSRRPRPAPGQPPQCAEGRDVQRVLLEEMPEPYK